MVTIPEKQFNEIKSRVIIHMDKIVPNLFMDITIKSQFFYVNTVEVCHMRYFEVDKWSFAFYTYGNDTYRPCLLLSGKDNTTIEEISLPSFASANRSLSSSSKNCFCFIASAFAAIVPGLRYCKPRDLRYLFIALTLRFNFVNSFIL